MKSVYLAAPFFSPQQKDRIAQVKAALGQNKTIDSTRIFIPHEYMYEAQPMGSFEWQKATFQLDTSQIQNSDLVVAIIDYKMEETKENEADSGTAFEIGFAYGLNKPIAVVQFDPKKELNMMVAQALTAYFDASKDGLKDLADYDFQTLMPQYAHRPVI